MRTKLATTGMICSSSPSRRFRRRRSSFGAPSAGGGSSEEGERPRRPHIAAAAGTVAAENRRGSRMPFPPLVVVVVLATAAAGGGRRGFFPTRSPPSGSRGIKIGIVSAARASAVAFSLPSFRRGGRLRFGSVAVVARSASSSEEGSERFTGLGREVDDDDGRRRTTASSSPSPGRIRKAVSNVSFGAVPPRRPTASMNPSVDPREAQKILTQDITSNEDADNDGEGLKDGNDWDEYLDPELYARSESLVLPDGTLDFRSSRPSSSSNASASAAGSNRNTAQRYNYSGKGYEGALEGMLSPPGGQYGSGGVIDDNLLLRTVSESSPNRVADPEDLRRRVFADEGGYLKSSEKFRKSLSSNSDNDDDDGINAVAELRREESERRNEKVMEKLTQSFEEMKNLAVSREDAMKRAEESRRRIAKAATAAVGSNSGREEESMSDLWGEETTVYCSRCGFEVTPEVVRHVREEIARRRRQGPEILCRVCHSYQFLAQHESVVRTQGAGTIDVGKFDKNYGGGEGYARRRKSFVDPRRLNQGRRPSPRNDAGTYDDEKSGVGSGERDRFRHNGDKSRQDATAPRPRRGIASLSQLGGQQLARRKKERTKATEARGIRSGSAMPTNETVNRRGSATSDPPSSSSEDVSTAELMRWRRRGGQTLEGQESNRRRSSRVDETAGTRENFFDEGPGGGDDD